MNRSAVLRALISVSYETAGEADRVRAFLNDSRQRRRVATLVETSTDCLKVEQEWQSAPGLI